MFDVLEVVHDFNRAGGEVTSHLVANQLETSPYKARKMLHSLHDLGLITWDLQQHRKNVLKRVYALTNRGFAVLYAFQQKESDLEGMLS